MPHLLFYGPPGTGKTSTILAVAKQIYSAREFNSMVLEVRTYLGKSKQPDGYRMIIVVVQHLYIAEQHSKTYHLDVRLNKYHA